MTSSAVSVDVKAESPDISIREYQETDPLELDERALDTLSTQVNADGLTRVEIIEQIDGTVRLKATEHVGVLSLPGGPTLEIRPKVPETDLLAMLCYAFGIEADTIEQETTLTAGKAFIEALAALYLAELNSVVKQGLHRDYQRKHEAVPHLRGRIDVQRQLQRQGVTPTEFECSYEELSADTIVNQSVLYATTLLRRFVRSRELSQALDRHHQRLRRRISLRTVRPVDLEGVELTRLTDHYSDLVRLTKLVLRSVYLEELRSGSRSSYALLVNMNEIFESTVERAVREAIADQSGWTMKAQASSHKLVSGGARSVSIRPDILVRDANRRAAIVGDAKWKVDEPEKGSRNPSNADIYQLVSYELAHDVPGVLFYPAQDGRVASEYNVHNLDALRVVEIPVQRRGSGSSSFADRVKEVVSSELAAVDDRLTPNADQCRTSNR